jgi:hypothetical protein
MDKLKIGSLYKLREGSKTKKGYGGQKVKLLQGNDSTAYSGGGVYLVETQEDFITEISTGKAIVKKGTVLHIFSKSDLIPL